MFSEKYGKPNFITKGNENDKLATWNFKNNCIIITKFDEELNKINVAYTNETNYNGEK